ncbi:MAG: hypothetical protein RSE48_00525 [Bacilli bacterium]
MLNMDCYFMKGVLIIRPTKEINKELIKQINGLISYCGIKNIVFNLSELKIKSLDLLIYYSDNLKKDGGKVLFCGLDDKIVNKNIVKTKNVLTALKVFNI